MRKIMVLGMIGAIVTAVAEAKPTEYECDDGGSESGYRIRVVDQGSVQSIVVLKKARGSASVVEMRKLKQVSASASGAQYESRAGSRLALKKPAADADGNWTGTFTLPSKRGVQTVRAKCGQVETLTM